MGATHVAVRTGVLQTCRGTQKVASPNLADQNRRVDVHWWVMHTGHSRFQGMLLAIDMHASLTQAHAHTVT